MADNSELLLYNSSTSKLLQCKVSSLEITFITLRRLFCYRTDCDMHHICLGHHEQVCSSFEDNKYMLKEFQRNYCLSQVSWFKVFYSC